MLFAVRRAAFLLLLAATASCAGGCRAKPSSVKVTKPEPKPSSAANPEDVLDHFLCYIITPDFKGPKVLLKDQFNVQKDPLQVGDRFMLCNPVKKVIVGIPGRPSPPGTRIQQSDSSKVEPKQASSGLLNPDAHLVCYLIPEEPIDKIVNISNQFILDERGKPKEVRFRARKSFLLCLPTGKKLAGSPKPPEVPKPNIMDHFKCYLNEGSMFQLFRKVILTDEIFPEGREFVAVQARLLCNPVEKTVLEEPNPTTQRNRQENGQPQPDRLPHTMEPHLLHPDAHLVCYTLLDDPDIKKSVLIANQFERNNNIQTKRTALLCLPSTKNEDMKKP